MKKIFAVLLAALLLFTCGISVFAAGTDDGTISVAEKGGKKFFGTETAASVMKYVAADGSEDFFYDTNADKTMNVCDLVATAKGQLDLDANGSYDAVDTEILRLMLIGGAN